MEAPTALYCNLLKSQNILITAGKGLPCACHAGVSIANLFSPNISTVIFF
jgi:hypothetical protein